MMVYKDFILLVEKSFENLFYSNDRELTQKSTKLGWIQKMN